MEVELHLRRVFRHLELHLGLRAGLDDHEGQLQRRGPVAGADAVPCRLLQELQRHLAVAQDQVAQSPLLDQ